ncbi:formyltransferase family protein [Lysinibacillus fusiformis]|uniref:formyltransferase family protein n=1 Tax=Lysinibacillus fusiformis TaxID=28031 RepID=UPI0023A97EF1|nr:formyltransferase family protein [Lysinibacillus fusiformis]WEA39922.1 formyltransferase family protein [Lysinibacillus fusiformis]
MKILFLGPYREDFCKKLQVNNDDEVYRTEEKISLEYVKLNKFDVIISYGYRHIISKDIINYLHNRIINLHISYLPWNRGADPNFWSFIEDTIKGVTIHLVDEGIDTGNIIIQKEVTFRGDITLRESYKILIDEIEKLFFEYWTTIRSGDFTTMSQSIKEGSIHYKKDRDKYNGLLINGWDTPVSKLKEMRN